MKKLLAILLTLMLPMYGLAEETAPEATLTTITFRDFDAKKLPDAGIDEATENAIRDVLDALRVEIYQQGTSASYEVFLNEQSLVDFALQLDGADIYVGSNLTDAAKHLNLEEDMEHLAALIGERNIARRSWLTDEKKAQKLDAYCATIAPNYVAAGKLLANITKNPLIANHMTTLEILASLYEVDFTRIQQRLDYYLPSMPFDLVRADEQPEGCDPARRVHHFTMTNEQLVNSLSAVLETAMDVPTVKDYADYLFNYQLLMKFMAANGDKDVLPEETDVLSWLRQQTLMPGDAQVTMYTSQAGAIVKLTATCEYADDVEATHTRTLTYNMNTLEDSIRGEWTLETEDGTSRGSLTTYATGLIELVVEPDEQMQQTIQFSTSPMDNGVSVYVASRTVNKEQSTDNGWELNLNLTAVDGQMQQDAEIHIINKGERFLTLDAKTRPCESRPLLSDGDVLDLGEISSARFNAYMLTLATSISQILPRILMNLPNSVRQLMDGTTTLPSSTIILDNAD